MLYFLVMENNKPASYPSDGIYYFNTHRPQSLVKSLQGRYERFDIAQASHIVENCLGEKVLSCKPDGNFGTGHVIFFVETESRAVVFRANVGIDTPEHYMDLEAKFIELYRMAGIPVGSILMSNTSRTEYPFDFQIQELLPGQDLETQWSGTKEQYNAISYQLGSLVARTYACPVEGWGRFLPMGKNDTLKGAKKSAFEYLASYLDYDLNVIKKSGLIDDWQSDAIKKHFTKSKPMMNRLSQAYLVHHDLADHNIRYAEDKIVAVFDWENAVAFDPVSDLASAPTWVCHFARKDLMIKGFLDTLGFKPENFEERVALYFLRTMLWKIAFAIKGERLSERHIKLFNEALADCGIDFTVFIQAKTQP